MFAEVATVGPVLFVMLSDEGMPGQAEQRSGIREGADEDGAVVALLFSRSASS